LVKTDVLMVQTRGLIGRWVKPEVLIGQTRGLIGRWVKPEVLIGQTRGSDWSNEKFCWSNQRY
jgi:hypothetical protein